jgi:zinc transporter ZupT
MASVGVGLVVEGVHEGAVAALLGVALGVGSILAVRSVPVRRLGRARSGIPAAVLVVGVMAAHSLAEGVAVGSSFAASGRWGSCPLPRSPPTRRPRASQLASYWSRAAFV